MDALIASLPLPRKPEPTTSPLPPLLSDLAFVAKKLPRQV